MRGRGLTKWLPRLAAACCFCLVSGCVQGPGYVKPSVSVPSGFRFDGQPAQTAPLPVEGIWWSGFGDRNLDALVQEALANNRDMHIATARVDEFAAILA